MATILDLPDIKGWEEVTFDPVRPRSMDRMLGRRTEALSEGTAYWVAHFVPGYLFWRDMGKMDAFMMRGGDDGEVFRAYDPARPRPIQMDTGKPLAGTRAAGGAFDGTATLTAITNSRTVTVSTLPAGFKFSAGDYVEFRQNNQQSLHRIMADVTASGAGVAVLSIKYGLDTSVFTTAAQVRLEKPSCLMQIDPGSYDGKKSKAARRPSFSATEVFVA